MDEECLLEDIVDEVLAQGVWITRARRLRGQELVESRPGVRFAMTVGLECKRTAGVIGLASRRCSRSGNDCVCHSHAFLHCLSRIHSPEVG